MAPQNSRPLVLWIEDYQRRKGWNRAEFAKQATVSASVISRWDNHGQVPRPDVLLRMARALGEDAEHLMVLAGYPNEVSIADPQQATLIAKLRQVRLSKDRYHILDELLDGLRKRAP